MRTIRQQTADGRLYKTTDGRWQTTDYRWQTATERCSSNEVRRNSLPSAVCRLPSLKRGVTLMEVLAALFVLSIGLLGVLAVIPFGSFQIAKARQAEYGSNMLAAAKAEVRIQEMISSGSTSITGVQVTPRNWALMDIKNELTPWVRTEGNAQNGIYCYKPGAECLFDVFIGSGGGANGTIQGIGFHGTLVCQNNNSNNKISVPVPISDGIEEKGIRMIDSSDLKPPGDKISKVTSLNSLEYLQGQDDVQYTLVGDERPVWKTPGSVNPSSSGRYQWFLTYHPVVLNNSSAGEFTVTATSSIVTITSSSGGGGTIYTSSEDKGILACYNRLPEMDQTFEVYGWTDLLSGAQITLGNALGPLISEFDWNKVKFVFVIWDNDSTSQETPHGCWGKVVSRGVDNLNKQILTVRWTGKTTSPPPYPPTGEGFVRQVYVPDGVVEHCSLD